MKAKLILISVLVLLGQNYLSGQERWHHLEGLREHYLWTVYAQNCDTLYVTGAKGLYMEQEGMIAKSTDGGLTWDLTSTTSCNLLKDVVFFDEKTGIAVGRNGVILKTTNAGFDWLPKESGTTKTLNAIAATGQDNVWVVGDDGVILKSTDGGELWQTEDLSLTDHLNDITFFGSEGYIVGNNWALYKSQDKGVTWHKEEITMADNKPLDEFSNSLYKVQKTRNNLYFLNGDSYPREIFKKTETGGCSPIAVGGNGFHMVEDGKGYGVHAGILTNGGQNIVQLFTIQNDNAINYRTILSSWSTYIDPYRADMSVVNDTMLYIASGNVLLKSSPNITSDVKAPFQNSELLTVQANPDGSLRLIADKAITACELLNTTGNILVSKILHTETNEITVNQPNMPKGIYLIRVVCSDKETRVYKWIKR